MARIGMKRDGADEIRAHPFFNGFVWEKLVGKTYKAPWTSVFSSSPMPLPGGELVHRMVDRL